MRFTWVSVTYVSLHSFKSATKGSILTSTWEGPYNHCWLCDLHEYLSLMWVYAFQSATKESIWHHMRGSVSTLLVMRFKCLVIQHLKYPFATSTRWSSAQQLHFMWSRQFFIWQLRNHFDINTHWPRSVCEFVVLSNIDPANKSPKTSNTASSNL